MGKLPDPAAAVPLSDYRSERLHAVELAHSKTPIHTHTRTFKYTNTFTHTHKHATQHPVRRSLNTHKHKHAHK